MKGKAPLSVFVLGAGKVGTSLTRALRSRGARVTLRAHRKGLPAKGIDADLLILAVRDGQLEALVEELAVGRAVGRSTAVVHCAGALGPEPLERLRGVALGVAQMHPMISFASPRSLPTLAGGQLHVEGDPAAARAARKVARLLGMTARTIPNLDKVAYHAAAGLVANGAAALAAAGQRLLVLGGVRADIATDMLGPLLRSVADNVERLGLPYALTGPVRRGDAKGVARHLDVIAERAPELLPLYRALVAAQVPLARAIGEAAAASFDAIEGLALLRGVLASPDHDQQK
ncbi:MAG TPA: Rossmann-like and DUF2520 domain-containing protein [Polyangiaceae bacterium]|nr:Rossmann-like and DUF2520 domain-containing protein [Polyangiaceae bacterium]